MAQHGVLCRGTPLPRLSCPAPYSRRCGGIPRHTVQCPAPPPRSRELQGGQWCTVAYIGIPFIALGFVRGADVGSVLGRRRGHGVTCLVPRKAGVPVFGGNPSARCGPGTGPERGNNSETRDTLRLGVRTGVSGRTCSPFLLGDAYPVPTSPPPTQKIRTATIRVFDIRFTTRPTLMTGQA